MRKYTKLTIKVASQTAYHLDEMSRAGQCSIGRVVDKLVRERMLDVRGATVPRASSRRYDREGGQYETD